LPDHGADVRPGRPVRGPPATPRVLDDRDGALLYDGDLAGVRAGQRRALLQLLHLLRLAVLRGGLHLGAARAPSAAHRVAAGTGGVSPPRAAGGVREAYRGRPSRAREPVAD